MRFIDKLSPFLGLVCLVGILGACATAPGPYIPAAQAPTVEDQSAAVLYDAGLQKWIAVDRVTADRLPDNRLKVMANVRNMKNQGITVQAQTQFKDKQGFSIGDDTAWQTILLGPNEAKTYETVSLKENADRFTVRIRHGQ